MMHPLDDLRGWTFHRPWPSAILADSPDAKRCENRSKPPPETMLGRYFAMHAGLKYGVGDWPWPGGIAIPSESECPIGIVGVARIVGAIDLRDGTTVVLDQALDMTLGGLKHRQRLYALDRDPWFVGPVGVLLDDVTPIDPILGVKGALGFWRVPLPIAAVVRERWEAARG